MHVFVTQFDIDHGVPGEELECPVALAIERAYPDRVGHIAVFEHQIEVGIDRHGAIASTYDTPEIVTAFIQLFDAGKPVEPFEFDLL